jgi:hypothetical protein
MTDTQDKNIPSETAHRLDDLFTAIRGALAQDAAVDARSAGALACRTILGVLDPSSRSTAPSAPASPTSPTSPLTNVLGAIGSIPREQIVELLVGGLRSILTQRRPTYLTRPAPPPTATRAMEPDRPVTVDQSSGRSNGKRSAVR